MKKIFTFLALAICATCFNSIYAQDGFNRHYLELGFGDNINLTPKSDNSSNELVPGAKRHAFTFSYRYSFFPFEHWGIYSDMYFSFPKWSLQSSMSKDGSNYYVVDPYYNSSSNEGLGGMSIGIMYRWENKRICIRPYAGFGFHDMKYEDYNYFVKEKGTNNVYRVIYELNNANNAYETSTVINSGVVIAYKFSKKLHVHLDINYMRHLRENRSLYYKIDAYEDYSYYDITRQYRTSKAERNLNIKLGLTWAVGFTNK